MADMVTGNVKLISDNFTAALHHVQRGPVKAISVISLQRMS